MKIIKRTIKQTETILLGFIWTVVFLSPLFVSESSDWDHILNVWLRVVPFLILSLINHFVLVPRLFYQKKKEYFASVAVVLALMVGILVLAQKSELDFAKRLAPPGMEEDFGHPADFEAPPIMGPQNNFGQRPPHSQNFPPRQRPGEMPLWLNSLLVGILVIGFDTGLRISFRWNQSEQEKAKMEKEKVKSELAFLRNQLSPHFFMNTLNNIHALIDIDSDEAKEAIIRLSKLMRHLLYDSDEERIPLTKEVQFIQSYVDLMKLRFTEKVKVTFEVEGALENIQIPPLLFTSLIENAFKYGISYKHTSYVHILLGLKENELHFTIENSKFDKRNSEEEKSGGIGLENTRKRFELLYASNYNLSIKETKEVYSVHLTLPV